VKSLKTIFVNYAPVFLLFPFSLAVGLYTLRESEILFQVENKPFFYFYIFFTVMPLYFFAFHSRQDFGQQVLAVLKTFFERFLLHKWIYLIVSVIFSIFYLYIASIRIATYYERDRWILENVLPILPIDVVIPQRLALVASWFTPIDIAVAVPNLVFILGWLAFLIYVSAGHGYAWPIALLSFVATFFSLTLYHTQYASFEFPSAVLGFIGLYGVWKKKINIGIFFLVLAVAFKNTGVFQVVAGVVLFLFICWKEGSLRRFLADLDIPLTVFLGLYLIVNYWGHLYYNLVLIDPLVLVVSESSRVFWFSSFWTFVQALLNNHTLILLFGILGAVFSRQYRLFSLMSLGVLFFTRSLSVRADDAYAEIFVPAFSFLTVFGVGYLWKWLDVPWKKLSFLTLMIAINGYVLIGVLSQFPGGMTHLNSNFDEFVGELARRLPNTGTIYQRDISLAPYLNNERGDMDSIRFKVYPVEKDEFISELSQPDCKLIVAERSHLAVVNIAESDMASMGYSIQPLTLIDNSGTWIAYSRDCTK